MEVVEKKGVLSETTAWLGPVTSRAQRRLIHVCFGACPPSLLSIAIAERGTTGPVGMAKDSQGSRDTHVR
jgi:hypothetical protein